MTTPEKYVLCCSLDMVTLNIFAARSVGLFTHLSPCAYDHRGVETLPTVTIEACSSAILTKIAERL